MSNTAKLQLGFSPLSKTIMLAKMRDVEGGFVLVGDDEVPNGEDWSATPVEYKNDGSIIYQLGGIDGDVLFEEAAQ
ncbi:hypothetical protein EAA37_22305 [Salmonella enterica]|nr:hypothetical protein [Salmonella enterica]